MDIATIVGILGCAAAVVYGIVNGDQGFAALGNFWDFSSVLVTIVGSMMCMVTMSESLGDFVSSLKSFALTIKAPKTNEGEVIHKIWPTLPEKRGCYSWRQRQMRLMMIF